MVNLYAIRDVKSGTYDVPFASVNHQTARRDFVMRLATDNALSALCPEDYDLLFVGTWDMSLGVCKGVDREFVCSGGSVAPDVGRVAGYIKEVMPK